MEQLRADLKAARERAYSLKTKKAQTKAWAKVREIEHTILMQLYDARNTYATHSAKATVRWFHEGDDHVALRLADGTTIYGSPTSDAVSKSWYGGTCCVQYVEGQTVVVEFDVDVDSERLALILVPKRIYGGTLDETRYAELCKRNDLAFFKYPNSNGVTGLFQNKAVQSE